MANVFISYARNDVQFVRDQMLPSLRQLGYTVWIDLDSIPGSVQWWSAITQSVANAAAVIVVLSPNSCASAYVAQELDHAQSCQRPILPVLIQGCQPPEAWRWLSQIQWIDFTREQFQNALARLDGGLRYRGISPIPPPPPAPPAAPTPKPLAQAILGKWRIDFRYQGVQQNLDITIFEGYTLFGFLHIPPEMFPMMYNGSWRVDEPHEVAFDGYLTVGLDPRPQPLALSFYIQNISDAQLEGFNAPDRTQCLWRRT